MRRDVAVVLGAAVLGSGCGRIAFDPLGGGEGSADASGSGDGMTGGDGGADVAPPSCPPTELMRDDFDDGMLSFGVGQVWAGTFESAVTIGEGQGQLAVSFPTGAATAAHAGVYTTRYDLTTACAVAQITLVPDQMTNAYAYVVLEESQGANRSKATLAVLGGMVIARTEMMQVVTVAASTPYNPTTHRWWRIRTGAGTFYWETSPDRVTWTTLHSEAAYFPLAQTDIVLGAGTDLAATAAGMATFDAARLYVP
jgi:hypothetical protein